MSEVCVIDLNSPHFSRVRDSELHTQDEYSSPIGYTERVLTILRSRGYELWTTPDPDVWYAVKGEEQLAVLRQEMSGNDTWHLAGATGDVLVTPAEAALCLRINSNDRASFRREKSHLRDEDLQRYINWEYYRLDEEALNEGVLTTQRSRHYFAYCMHLLDKDLSEQDVQVGRGLARKLSIPARINRI